MGASFISLQCKGCFSNARKTKLHYLHLGNTHVYSWRTYIQSFYLPIVDREYGIDKYIDKESQIERLIDRGINR